MENIKISVIIPNYNGSKTLESVVKSCLNQTLPPFEVIICDDGSTDKSKEIVEQIEDSRVIWIPLAHSGTPAIPRNYGMKISKGDWIAFCDSDDEWLPRKLEKQIYLAIKLNCKASCTNALIKKNGFVTSEKVSVWKDRTLSFRNIVKNNDIVCSSSIIHSSIFKEIDGFSPVVEYGSFADYIYWLRVTTITNFAFINEPLVIYDDHPETSIRSMFTDGRLLKEKAFSNFKKWARKNTKNNLYYIFQIKKYFIVEWSKNILRNIIELCFKK